MDYTKDVIRIKEYINEHLEDNLSPEKIAAVAGYSTFHFCRVFKQCDGRSLMKYVREKRLEKAEIEVEGGARLAEVAIKYGFETSSGFSRAYERQYGSRPTKKLNA